jgi:hypothetical protein
MSLRLAIHKENSKPVKAMAGITNQAHFFFNEAIAGTPFNQEGSNPLLQPVPSATQLKAIVLPFIFLLNLQLRCRNRHAC